MALPRFPVGRPSCILLVEQISIGTTPSSNGCSGVLFTMPDSRIGTLLSQSNSPRQSAPRRPHPDEAHAVSSERAAKTLRLNEYVASSGYNLIVQPTGSRPKSSVPIAEVLNNETPSTSVSSPSSAPPTGAAPAFSGRLSDILLDPSQYLANKKWNSDGEAQITPAGLPVNDNKLTLPSLPPRLPKKTTRRPRIPPLLQGLHQPPPLPPEGRLFPPITGEGRGFGGNLGERVGLRAPSGHELQREDNANPNAVSSNNDASAAKEKEKESQMHRIGPGPAHDKDNIHEEADERAGGAGTSKLKEKKQRNKWSDEETKHLLQGVSRFGIGSWKKILECSDFHFNQRTAVDLKDRFRTCCPGQGTKVRKSRAKGAQQERAQQKETDCFTKSVSREDACVHEIRSISQTSVDGSVRLKKPRCDNHRKGPAELAEMGIQAPFTKSQRRERRPFTEEDDVHLFEGYRKYGAGWHLMRDDSELGFSMRHPTDLRDRFRIRFPELYARAGYKLKCVSNRTRNEIMLKEKDGAETHYFMEQKSSTAAPGSSSFSSEAPPASTAEPSLEQPGLRAHALLQPLLNSFPAFDDFHDLVSEDDDEFSSSPVTLSSNILHWNTAPSTTSAVPAPLVSMYGATSLAGDGTVNPWPSVDGLHIDPRALGLHVSTAPNVNAAVVNTSTPMWSNPLATSFSLSHAGGAPTTQPSSSYQHSRNPNLPSLVFPHVPTSNARNATHNLPPPADLLSGLDTSSPVRSEMPTSNPFLGDGFASLPGMGTAMGSTPSTTLTLAPLGTGRRIGQGIGVLVAQRQKEMEQEME